MRHYCLGGCSAPSVSARRSRPVRGARAGTWCCVSPVSPIPPRVSRAACGGPSCPGVPYPRSLVRHSTWSVRSACSVRLPFWLSPRALCVCVRSRSRGVRSPPLSVVWRAHLARSRLWALVGRIHVVRAPPRVLPRSLAPSGVLGGGRSGPGSPLPGCRCEGRLRSGAPPPPTARPLGGLLGSATHVLWARVCGCGGPTLSPWPACPVGAACRGGGVVGGRPRGGVACHCCEGRLVSRAVPPPTARPLGGRPGPPTQWLSVWGDAGVGTHHQPHRARSCELALRAVGAARGRPGGGASCLGVGRPGSGALPPPSARPLGGLPAPTTHWLWVLGLRAWVPVTNPGACALACCWGGMRVPGGGASCLGVGRPGSGALPPPNACPLGGLPGPTTHWLWVRRGCGRGDPSPTPQRALLRAGFARCGGGMRVPWGGASCLRCGASGVGRSPTPDCPPLGRAAGAHYQLAVGAGGCGRGDPSPAPQRALLRAGFARCGGGMRVPRGGASCLGVGRPGSGALPTSTARPLGGLPGPNAHWLWVPGDAGVGTRHQPHSARSCELALPAVGAA